jgi:hypothetical protein
MKTLEKNSKPKNTDGLTEAENTYRKESAIQRSELKTENGRDGQTEK